MNLPGWKSLGSNIDRVFFALLLCIAAYYLPTWMFVVIGAIGILTFSYCWEVALVFFIIELVFGLPRTGWSPYFFIGTIGLLLAVLIIEEIKNRIFVNRY